MPRYRADLDVSGDLVLPLGSDPFVIAGDGCVATFRNAPNDSDGYAPGLMVTVVGEATSMEDAAELLRKRLARLLDLLAFATHSKFKIVQIRRLIEWEPRMKTRQFRAYQIFDRRYPPDPELDPEYARSVGNNGERWRRGFRHRGASTVPCWLLDTQQQDQFQRFWLAFEVISEGRKGSALVRIKDAETIEGTVEIRKLLGSTADWQKSQNESSASQELEARQLSSWALRVCGPLVHRRSALRRGGQEVHSFQQQGLWYWQRAAQEVPHEGVGNTKAHGDFFRAAVLCDYAR